MRFFAGLFAVGLILAVAGTVGADTLTFTASDVKSIMASQGAPLSNAQYQWGLWAVRVMPIVNGTYTITGGTTTQAGWGVAAPNGAFGRAPFSATNSAWFYDESGSEVVGNPANPLYMIMDTPADTFYSSVFNPSGTWAGQWAPKDGLPAPVGTNVITAVGDASAFSFDFTLDPGATWNGSWRFVVDGSRFAAGTAANPGAWDADFFGGYGANRYDGQGYIPIGLAGNENGQAGFAVPEPLTMAGLMLGIGSLVTYVRKRRKA